MQPSRNMGSRANVYANTTQTTNRLGGDLARYGPSTIYEQSRRYIHVTSRDDPNGTAARFRVPISGRLSFDELSLSQAFIPNNFYNLYDSITFEEQLGGGPVTITLPDGIYRIFDDPASNFQPALKLILDTNSPNGLTYTVTFNETTQKITVSSTGNFRFLNIDPLTNITYRSMGYNATNLPVTQAFAASQVSTGSVNFLAGISNGIRVRIKNLPYVGESSTNNNYFTFMLTNLEIIGGFINGKTPYPYKYSGNLFISEFDIELLDDMGNLLRIRDQTTLIFEYTLRIN